MPKNRTVSVFLTHGVVSKKTVITQRNFVSAIDAG